MLRGPLQDVKPGGSCQVGRDQFGALPQFKSLMTKMACTAERGLVAAGAWTSAQGKVMAEATAAAKVRAQQRDGLLQGGLVRGLEDGAPVDGGGLGGGRVGHGRGWSVQGRIGVRGSRGGRVDAAGAASIAPSCRILVECRVGEVL